MISIIAAIDKNRGIGRNNKLPWNIPEDLKHFKEITDGHPVIMGRKTFESIGRALPGRANLVVTGNTSYVPDGVIVKHSINDAITYAQSIDPDEIFIIGGGELYKHAIGIAGRLYLTIIDGEFDVDSWFPEYDSDFTIIEEHKLKNDRHSFAFKILERIQT